MLISFRVLELKENFFIRSFRDLTWTGVGLSQLKLTGTEFGWVRFIINFLTLLSKKWVYDRLISRKRAFHVASKAPYANSKKARKALLLTSFIALRVRFLFNTVCDCFNYIYDFLGDGDTLYVYVDWSKQSHVFGHYWFLIEHVEMIKPQNSLTFNIKVLR